VIKKIIAAAVAPLLLAASLLTPNAVAAPKSVAAKKIEKLFAVPDAEGLLASGTSLITFSNTGGANSNVLVTSFDLLGATLWQLTIDSGVDEVATAATTDTSGNIWLAGSAAAAAPLPESATATSAAENPDGVLLETIVPIRADMKAIALWKLSSAGELLATYISAQSAPALVNGIAINNSGVSLVGKMQERSFLINSSLSGVMGKALFIGSSKTNLTSVVRSSDGSVNVFGDSTETLAGKKLAGIRDGILVKVSKSGAIKSLVRSSAIKGERSWLAADTTLTLTGSVKVGKNIESAVTRFNSSFAPLWTARYSSNGNSRLIASGNKSYLAFGSTSAIKGIKGWRPSEPQLLVLSFDSKGRLLAATGSADLVSASSLAYSKEIGLFGIATARDSSLHIFKAG
jgi:hypothetical protein